MVVVMAVDFFWGVCTFPIIGVDNKNNIRTRA
jgi:hypothetical protein